MKPARAMRRAAEVAAAGMLVALVACSSNSGTILPSNVSTSFVEVSALKSPIELSDAALSLLGTGKESTQQVTVSEPGYKGAFAEKSTCAKIATAAPKSGKGPSLKVSVTGVDAGACAITFSDKAKHSAKLSIFDTTASIALTQASISPASKSIVVTLTSVDGKPPSKDVVASVTEALPSCDSGCTVAAPQTPPGEDTFVSTIFDGTDGKGNKLAAGTSTLKIVAAKHNSVAVTLAKIPAFLSLGALPTPPAGASFTTPVQLTVLDADHHPIAGAYATSVTVTDSDTSPLAQGSSLTLNAGSPSRSVKLTKSTDTVELKYGGSAISPVTIAATATGVSEASVPFAPTTKLVYSGPENAAGAPEIDLYDSTAGQQGYEGSFTMSEAGWSKGFTYQLGGTNNDCKSFTVTPGSGSGSTFTVAVAASPTAGKCTMTVGGASGTATVNVTLTYATSSIGVYGKR
jgi:hypothetical protein